MKKNTNDIYKMLNVQTGCVPKAESSSVGCSVIFMVGDVVGVKVGVLKVRESINSDGQYVGILFETDLIGLLVLEGVGYHVGWSVVG